MLEGGDPEAGEHAAERRRLQEHEHELERRVADGKSNPGTSPSPDSPPANAVKKNSGKISDGSRYAGLVRMLWSDRQATASATCTCRLMSAPASSAGRWRRRTRPARPSPGDPEAERDRLPVPPDHDERADPLDQVRDRVVGGDRAEPVLLDERPGRYIEDRKSRTKKSGKNPCTASPSRSAGRRTRRARERQRDQQRQRQQRRDARAGLEVHARR